jgi:hypothetical protein
MTLSKFLNNELVNTCLHSLLYKRRSDHTGPQLNVTFILVVCVLTEIIFVFTSKLLAISSICSEIYTYIALIHPYSQQNFNQ